MFNATTRSVFLAASALLCLGFAHPAHAATVLLNDDFNDNSLDGLLWSVVTAGITQDPKSVNEVNQHIELEGRAHLNTFVQYNPAAAPEDGIRITGQWTFVSNDDMLQILTRSDGTPGGSYGETGNGVQFYVGASGIGNNMTINSLGGASVVGAINSGALDAVAGETYDFEIRDDGTNLYFGMRQVGGPKQRQVFAVSPSVMGSNFVTFHNRESGRRSNLDNVVIDSPTAPAAHAPLSDDFNDNWIDADKWNVVGNGISSSPKSVVESGGRMELEGRAHLNTQAQYDPLTAPNDGIRIRGQWTFDSGGDFMQVLTRSDGTPGGSWGETDNGVEFIAPAGGNMNITGRGGAAVSGVVNSGSPGIAAGETYDFDIRDDGYNLFFTMREVGGTKRRSMIAASNSALAQNLITFHNREGSNRSNLDNVRIDSPRSNTVGLGGPILLEDRFNDNSLDGSLWNVVTSGIPQNPKSVTEQDQRIRLEGRAHLNTVEEFDPVALGGLTVRGRWTFQSSDDFMQILTRSDGTPGGSWGDTNNGLDFRAYETATVDNVGIVGHGATVSNQVNASLPILAGETYDFQILDDGNEVSLLLTQVGGPKAAVATATSSSVMGTNLVTFHNRESGRVSHLDNVVIASGTPDAMTLGGGGDFLVREVHSTGTIGSLADADALLGGTGVAGQSSGLYETINFGAGSDGLFGSDDAFPGGGGDSFAVQVTGQIGILAEGDYVFGLNMDDGARLMIDDQLVIFDDGAQGSARNAYGHLELSAGTHSLDLVFFHQDGSEQLELFYFDGAGTRFLATAVPEPASIVLMGLAALCAAGFARRRRRRARAG